MDISLGEKNKQLRVLSSHKTPQQLVQNDVNYDPYFDKENNFKKLFLNNATAEQLSQEPDVKKIANPLAEKTWTATFVFGSIVFIYLLWIFWIYGHYISWCENSNHKLPDVSIVSAGIPIFIFCIFLEWIISKVINYETFRLNDTTAAFSNGLYQQMLDSWMSAFGEQLGVALITAIPYRYIFENYRIADVNGTMGFILMFFARDFCYYWFHYFAHSIAFMWAIHGVHHQPNEFNMSVNLSQGALQRISSVPFYLPLAFFFSPELYSLIFPVEKIYGFLTHTKLINNCYGIASFFVTPSSHRVHHGGRPAKVIDRNFGEVLTIWDRLFGTFQEEQEPIVFGHVMPIESWDPFESQIATFKELYNKSKLTDSWVKKIKCFVCSPGYNPIGPDYDLIDSHPFNTLKYDSTLPGKAWVIYAVIHHILVVGMGIFLLRALKVIEDKILLAVVMLYIAYSASCIGRIWDRNGGVIKLEIIRLILLPLVVKFVSNLFNYQSLYYVKIGTIISLISLLSIYFLPRLYNEDETESQRWERNWITEYGRKFNSLIKKQE